jgi:predicted transglutaminase-like cysteine proteinase
VVARTEAQSRSLPLQCGHDPAHGGCLLDAWNALVDELRGLPEEQRIEQVNALLNHVPYVSAVVNWHDPDHWETPFEFLARGGQCEDYAIAKFMLLAATGMSSDRMRLVVVRDRDLQLDHAVLVVFVNDKPLVLDNQITDIAAASSTNRYVPYYSINLFGWWLHKAG